MQTVTNYTTTDAIRGCLGIDEDDCTDDTIVNSNLHKELLVDLDDWLPTHSTLFDAGKTSTATATDKRIQNLIALYSQWFCAYEVACRFLLVPQIVTDGKAQMNRYPNFKLEEMANQAAARRDKYRSLLDQEVNDAPDPIGSAALFSVVVPDYDPVTNT